MSTKVTLGTPLRTPRGPQNLPKPPESIPEGPRHPDLRREKHIKTFTGGGGSTAGPAGVITTSFKMVHCGVYHAPAKTQDTSGPRLLHKNLIPEGLTPSSRLS